MSYGLSKNRSQTNVDRTHLVKPCDAITRQCLSNKTLPSGWQPYTIYREGRDNRKVPFYNQTLLSNCWKFPCIQLNEHTHTQKY